MCSVVKLLALLLLIVDEDQRLEGRDLEALPAALARHVVIDADEMVAKLRVERAVARVGAGREAIFFHATEPPYLVRVPPLAPRAGIFRGFLLRALGKKVPFLHEPIISQTARGPTPAHCRR